ncbi:MAG: hypothetical protein F6K62_14545 [Sphaerospermopsis sp. SIO1G2]|nr:hypothetical protein [Sphaerospermopsis sp. SIO1G2]
MDLNAKYESTEALLEAIQSDIVEVDGEVSLRITGAKPEEEFQRVYESLRKERDDHKGTKSKYSFLSDYGEIEDVHNKLLKFPELEAQLEAAGDKMSSEDIEKLVSGRLETHLRPIEREREALKEKISEQERQLNSFKQAEQDRERNEVIRKAAKEAKVVESAIEDVVLLASRDFEYNEAGGWVTRETKSDIGGKPATSWLQELQVAKPHWWPENVGGGAHGGVGGSNRFATNPWNPENKNVTEQGRIYRENPELAKKMAAQFGQKIG